MVRIVGDVHGKIDEYIELVKDSDSSIQIGDMGFNYSKLAALDSAKHKVFGGNHDNYLKVDGEYIHQTPHFLGNFGPLPNEMFYIRGGLSIEKKWRTEGFDWFPDEELNYSQSLECLELYATVKPKVVLSHECPQSIISMFTMYSDEMTMHRFGCKLPSHTSLLLEQLLYIHRPELWVFGHYHMDRTIRIEETKFQCLNELSYLDIPL